MELRLLGLRAGRFVSMPGPVRLLGVPLAPTREAVKRAARRPSSPLHRSHGQPLGIWHVDGIRLAAWMRERGWIG